MKTAGLMRYSWLLPLTLAILSSAPARANIIISVTSVAVAAGGSGAFDVNIQNTGAVQNITAFSFGLSVSNPGITFTGGNMSTANTYIFSGDSFDVNFGQPFAAFPTAQSVEASDLSLSGNGNNMGATTLGLGHILFSVASNVSGPVTVTLATGCSVMSSCTSLSDNAGHSVGFSTSNGTITVTGASVPEPSTLLLALLALPVLGRLTRRNRRDTCP
jgi:hypothetical protein